MKSYDVFMDSFVNVMVPDDLEPDSPEFVATLVDKAAKLYCERIKNSEISFNWERYEENDTVDCALCGKQVRFADSYSPGDEAICEKCNGEVTEGSEA